MSHAQKDEFIHFAIDLELLRRTPVWRNIMRNVLFKNGELLELAEKAEETLHDD
jgi:hypothetical protein